MLDGRMLAFCFAILLELLALYLVIRRTYTSRHLCVPELPPNMGL